jgi:amidase
VPFTVKENLDVAGSPTTAGVAALRDNIAAADAPVVARLRSAGAIPLARTNLPDFALRFHTDNALHGAAVNPWNPWLTPGGSSGGGPQLLLSAQACGDLGFSAGQVRRRGEHVCAAGAAFIFLVPPGPGR